MKVLPVLLPGLLHLDCSAAERTALIDFSTNGEQIKNCHSQVSQISCLTVIYWATVAMEDL